MKKRRRIPHVLLLIELSRAFGRRVVEGIAQYARENGPWAIHFDEWGIDSYSPTFLKDWRCDGIISRAINSKLIRLVKSANVPRVELMGGSRTDKVEVKMNSADAADMAFEHFFKHGFRRFGFCAPEFNWWTIEHNDQFRRAVEARGFAVETYPAPNKQKTLALWREQYYNEVSRWIGGLPRPIGIYASTDLTASRLIEICQQSGINVPKEIAILGIGNDILLCETIRPTLSSIDLDARRIGYEAAKLLDKKMAGKAVPDKTILVTPSHIVTRQSTDYTIVEDAEVFQAMQWIHATACSGLDVNRLSRKLGMSRKVLERRFRFYFGTTPKKEIVKVRIEKAKMLLGQTEETLMSIVHKCGFNSRVYFMRAFRREVGVPPGEYRRQQRISRTKSE